MQKISPFLWFDTQAEAATNFYVSLFPDAKIHHISKMGETVFSTSFEIGGQYIQAINAGPQYHFTEAISFFVQCESQEEVDRYWTALTADGGQEGQCGWLKDKFGLSWQIVPKVLGSLISGPDREKSGRAMQAMLKMKKLHIQELQDAFDGKA